MYEQWLPFGRDPRYDPEYIAAYKSGDVAVVNIVTGQWLVTKHRDVYFQDGRPAYLIGCCPIPLRKTGEPDRIMQPSAYSPCGPFSFTTTDKSMQDRFGGPYDRFAIKLPIYGDVPADEWSESLNSGGEVMETFTWLSLPCKFEEHYWPLAERRAGHEDEVQIQTCDRTPTLNVPCVDPIGVK